MLYYGKGYEQGFFTSSEMKEAITGVFEKLGKMRKVLAIPPDYTRFHSYAGEITRITWEFYRKELTDILPALGTHSPMTSQQIFSMFGDIPASLFRVHDWRNEIVTLGEVPADFIKQVSEDQLNYPWPAQVNRLLIDPGLDLILSIGQVVPHEVIGMANYNKNIFVGTGGAEGINKSHFLGAVYGMERIMGRAMNPVREVLNYASDHFARNLPVIYILTVVAKSNGRLGVKGLFIGDDSECFIKASELSLKVNFTMLEKPLRKVVAYLDPAEVKSTWLGNKSIYRSRMAIEDEGELIILAPGLREFGEDKEIDRLIRKYGYRTTEKVLESTRQNEDLQKNLSAAAHLIHGSSENRFRITYCPGYLSKEEIEKVNYSYADLHNMLKKYDPSKLEEGFNHVGGEDIYFIPNPALGLWTSKDRFNEQ
jgi:nickel-dependent lactate racemase